jgi:hypothetical protein
MSCEVISEGKGELIDVAKLLPHAMIEVESRLASESREKVETSEKTARFVHHYGGRLTARSSTKKLLERMISIQPQRVLTRNDTADLISVDRVLRAI